MPPAFLRPAVAAVLAICLLDAASAVTPPDIARGFESQAGAPGHVERGRTLFTRTQGGQWSCSSCHGVAPTGTGQHASTGKSIAPLAPAFNSERFTDPAKVEKWFRRNCKDVLSRECSASEKADVMAFLMSLKP